MQKKTLFLRDIKVVLPDSATFAKAWKISLANTLRNDGKFNIVRNTQQKANCYVVSVVLYPYYLCQAGLKSCRCANIYDFFQKSHMLAGPVLAASVYQNIRQVDIASLKTRFYIDKRK